MRPPSHCVVASRKTGWGHSMADRMAEDRYPERFDENRQDWDRRLRAHADGEGSEAERAALDAWLRRDASAMARYRELGGASGDYSHDYYSQGRPAANDWRDTGPPPETAPASDFTDDPFAEASRPSSARRGTRASGGGGGWPESTRDAARPPRGVTAENAPLRETWPEAASGGVPESSQRTPPPDDQRYEDYWANVNQPHSEAPRTSASPATDRSWDGAAYPGASAPQEARARPNGSDPLSALKAARTAYGPSERGFSLPPLERDTPASAPPPSYGAEQREWSRPPEPPAPPPGPRYEPRTPPSHSAPIEPPVRDTPAEPAYPAATASPPPIAPRESELRRHDYPPTAYETSGFPPEPARPDPPRVSARSAQTRRPVLGSVAAARPAPAPSPSATARAASRAAPASREAPPSGLKPGGPSARPDRRTTAAPSAPPLQETRAPRAKQSPSPERPVPRQPTRSTPRQEPPAAPYQEPTQGQPGARRAAPQTKPAAQQRPAPAQRAKSGGAAPSKPAPAPQQARAKGPAPKEAPRNAKSAPGNNAEAVTAALRKEAKPPHRAPARLGFATALAAFAALAFGFYLGVALGGVGGAGAALDWRERVAVSSGLKIPENFALRQTPPTASRAAVQKLGALLEVDLTVAADPPVGLSLQEASHLMHEGVDLAHIDYLDAAGTVVSLTVARRNDTPDVGEKLSYDTLSLADQTGVEWRSDTHIFLIVGAAPADDLRRFAYVFGKELN